MRRVTEPGGFTFFVGASSTAIRAEATTMILGEVVEHPLRELGMTSAQSVPIAFQLGVT
jgi:hypothetical protein